MNVIRITKISVSRLTKRTKLRGLIASGMRKELRDDIKKDKFMLMDILEELKMAA